VTATHGGLGYARKLRDQGVKVWAFDSPNQQAPLAAFRKRCAEEKITGVYFEGGRQLLSEFLQERALDYLFVYRAPILLADTKAKPAFAGLRTEKLINAVRLTDVRHEAFGDDALMRGRVLYPERMFIDEALFSLG